MTTATALPPLPRRPLPTVRRSSLRRTMWRYTGIPEVRAVELVLTEGEVTQLVVHWTTGRKTHLTVTEDVR